MWIVRSRTYVRALKRLKKLGATPSDIDRMEDAIAANPDGGERIPGGGGLRKMRFGYGLAGKRGGGRTIYYAFAAEMVGLITAYAKVDKVDISTDERRLFLALVKELSNDEAD